MPPPRSARSPGPTPSSYRPPRHRPSNPSPQDDQAIDAVYIALPDHLHAEYTVRSAAAGKHVLCEKPMATTVDDAQKMIDACKRADRRLMIAYRIQYEPHNRYIMQAARDRRFGKVTMIEGHNGQNMGDPSQWRLKKAAGGGALADVGIYCLNTCRFVLGEEPLWVSGAAYSTPNDPRFKEVDENVVFQLGFPSGALGSFSCSFGTHRSNRYRCHADYGGWVGADPAFDYDGLQLELSQVRGKEEAREHPLIAAKQQFALELDHFAACVRGKKQPYTPGEEGLQDVRIIEAIFQSAAPFFHRLGFTPAVRGEAPAELRASPEFAAICYATAGAPQSNRRFAHSATFTKPISAGTSTSGPSTAANAAPLWMPKL
ncbi:MAG TPA: Gfo/Idh/MocA family oxidoreductase, partial [Kofleriaceae bacterium]|nr:Gfo/Idh/MocA family oxidoreductase [Kofleriaceae bacterium]